jgi:hypothetical protein
VRSRGMRNCKAQPGLCAGQAVSHAHARIRGVVYRGPAYLLAIGAVCGNSARTDLCGGRLVMGVPTAILSQHLPYG